MWTKYFKVVKIRRGRVITPRHGEIDFSRDNIPVEICQQLYEEDFPYLEITEEGKRELYGIEMAKMLPSTRFAAQGAEAPIEEAPVTEFVETDPVFEPLPPAEENPEELKTSVPIRPDVPVSEPYSTSKKRNRRSSN